MRSWLEKQRRNYVLAVPETHLIWIAGQPQPVGLVAALLPACAWVVLSAGEGSQGPRLYEWAWLSLAEEPEVGSERGAWLLIRHITLALLAHAVLVVMRTQEKKREKTKST